MEKYYVVRYFYYTPLKQIASLKFNSRKDTANAFEYAFITKTAASKWSKNKINLF